MPRVQSGTQFAFPGFEPGPRSTYYDRDAFVEDAWFLARQNLTREQLMERIGVTEAAYEKRLLVLRRAGIVDVCTPRDGVAPNRADFRPTQAWLTAHPDEDWAVW